MDFLRRLFCLHYWQDGQPKTQADFRRLANYIPPLFGGGYEVKTWRCRKCGKFIIKQYNWVPFNSELD